MLLLPLPLPLLRVYLIHTRNFNLEQTTRSLRSPGQPQPPYQTSPLGASTFQIRTRDLSPNLVFAIIFCPNRDHMIHSDEQGRALAIILAPSTSLCPTSYPFAHPTSSTAPIFPPKAAPGCSCVQSAITQSGPGRVQARCKQR